jgi:hypothetical protein
MDLRGSTASDSVLPAGQSVVPAPSPAPSLVEDDRGPLAAQPIAPTGPMGVMEASASSSAAATAAVAEQTVIESAPDLHEFSYLEEAPLENVLALLNESKEEIKVLIELARCAEDEGNLDKAQLFKLQMRREVVFMQRARRRLGARRSLGRDD